MSMNLVFIGFHLFSVCRRVQEWTTISIVWSAWEKKAPFQVCLGPIAGLEKERTRLAFSSFRKIPHDPPMEWVLHIVLHFVASSSSSSSSAAAASSSSSAAAAAAWNYGTMEPWKYISSVPCQDRCDRAAALSRTWPSAVISPLWMKLDGAKAAKGSLSTQVGPGHR